LIDKVKDRVHIADFFINCSSQLIILTVL